MALKAVDIFEGTFLAVIFIVTMVGNGIVSIILLKHRSFLLKNRPTYQFILNMVISDLVVGLLTMPFELINVLLNEWIFGRMACKIIEFIEIAVLGTAVFTHALIAFDRYRSLAHPYLPKIETRVVRKMLILSWIIPTFVSTPYLYMFEISLTDSNVICTPNTIPIKWLDKLYEAVEFSLVLLIPFLILCWCYFHVAWIMRRGSGSVSDACDVTRLSVISKSKRRVTRTAGLVAITFTVCWLPTFIVYAFRIVAGTDYVHRGHFLSEIALFGTFINEAINPIIYCSFDGNIKGKVRLRAMCKLDENTVVSMDGADQVNRRNSATEDAGTQMSVRTAECNRKS